MSYARNKALGEFGERLAAEHLRAAGMALLARNWTCRYGEIDIVARDGQTLVVCEVKTRSSAEFGSPLEAVGPRKAARLRRLAAHWLQVHSVQPSAVRIDVVSVLVPAKGSARVERIIGAA